MRRFSYYLAVNIAVLSGYFIWWILGLVGFGRKLATENSIRPAARTKAARMEMSITERGADQVLYEEVLAALGYKNNSGAFRKLAFAVPLESLVQECNQDTVKAYALLLGVSGLLPSGVPQRWDNETRSFVRQLWDHWWKLQAKWENRRLPAGEWKLSSLRPQNSPVRRLAAAAAVFAGGKSLSARLAKADVNDPGKWHRLVCARR